MWRLNVRKSQGFTLIEMLATGIIISIVAAIAAPNLLGLLNRNRVNRGLAEFEGAIKEAQRQAIRNGKSCTITINAANNNIVNAPTDGCLLSTRNLSENLEITTNIDNNGTTDNYDIVFSGKGNMVFEISGTEVNSGAIFVIYMPSGTNQQRCFVVDSSLGSVRTGEYTGSPTGTLNLNNCI